MRENVSCDKIIMWYQRREELQTILELRFVMNGILAIPTAIFNILILITIWRTSSLHSPSNVFLCNLAISDHAVAIFSEPVFTAWGLVMIYSTNTTLVCSMTYVVRILGSVGSIVSFLTIAAATVDCYLALKLHLRYVSIVTISRFIVVCVVLWVISIGAALISLISFSTYIHTLATGAFLVVGVMVFCYYKIFLIIRHHHNQIHSQMSNNGAASLTNMLRYKKSLFNLIYVLILYVLFYSPYITALIVYELKGFSASFGQAFVVTVMIAFANSAVNPFIYCWRLRELRQAVRQTCLYIVTKIKCKMLDG